MQRITTCAALLLWFVAGAPYVAAQDAKPESKPVEGTLTVGKSIYKLSHAVAYETKHGDEACIAILASDRKIPFNEIQDVLKKNDGNDEQLSLDQPNVVITFKKSGEALWCSAKGDGGSFSRSGELPGCKLKFENGRASGEAKLVPPEDAIVKSAFDFRWDLTLGAEGATKPTAKPAGPVKPSVTGTFMGNGKPAKLAFVSARPGEPFDGKSSILIVFTEKDHSKDPKPDFKAGFGDYGSALVISVFENGKIFSCQVAHAAHGKMPFSSSGSVSTAGFEVGEGRVEGEVKTDGEQKFFDKTWEVDLKFVAPYTPPAAKPAVAATPKEKMKTSDKSAKATASKAKPATKSDSDGDDDDDEAPAKSADSLNVKDLALPKDATDVAYKKLVEHMSFKSPSAVQALAADFSKKLAAQGWKADDSDLVTPKSAILKRARGGATLTIFIKPADKGSAVTIMTEGLDWAER